MFEKVEKSNMIFESFCRMIESFSNNDASVFWWQEQRSTQGMIERLEDVELVIHEKIETLKQVKASYWLVN